MDMIDHIIQLHRDAMADIRLVLKSCSEVPHFEPRYEPRQEVCDEKRNPS